MGPAVDAYRCSGGIDYFYVNSASYYWMGESFGGLAKYRDPLFAFVSIENGVVTIEGRQSEFLPPTPKELNHPNAARVTASTKNRRVVLSQASGSPTR